MTKKHFITAANIVQNIAEGNWTMNSPSWANEGLGAFGDALYDDDTEQLYRYTRAVQTAEAFIHLFASDNPRFDQVGFLYACGLEPKPVAKRRTA